MAEVFVAAVARPDGTTERVAIKRLLDDLTRDPVAVMRFFDEARLACQLVHPNIARVFELNLVDGSYLIAMEWVDGLCLSRLHVSGRPRQRFPFDLCAEIGRQVCQALGYAHDFHDADGQPARIIHRDISPKNIVVRRDGVVKLLDFGIAKAALNLSQTCAGLVLGTPTHMSPEQIAQNVRLDHRSDLFSLGVVLFELATGVQPFGRGASVDYMRAILSNPAPDPASITPEIPDTLGSIIVRALQKDRDRRYPDADAMQKDLEGYLGTSSPSKHAQTLALFVQNLLAPVSAESELPTSRGGFAATERDSPRPTVIGTRRDKTRFSRWLLSGAGVAAAAAILILTFRGHFSSQPEPTRFRERVQSTQDSSPIPVVTPRDGAVPTIPFPSPERSKRLAATPKAKPRPTPSSPTAVQRSASFGLVAPSSAPLPAFLLVDTRPWTNVQIDGVDYGPTPVGHTIELIPGEHRIRFPNPEQGIDREERIVLAPGESAFLRRKF
jgi:eukaryotic-like serine/threonine-protein kinase